MKFIIKNGSRESITTLARKIGYYFLGKDEQKEEMAFARPVKGYPRFHLFLKIGGEDFIFSLHLDQKKPIYQGTTAHSGEYDSEIVAKEAERIKEILQKEIKL